MASSSSDEAVVSKCGMLMEQMATISKDKKLLQAVMSASRTPSESGGAVSASAFRPSPVPDTVGKSSSPGMCVPVREEPDDHQTPTRRPALSSTQGRTPSRTPKRT
jgi:hypothetical protein